MAAWREERALTDCCRCFLYLVNYARIKPEIALKALPIIQEDMHDNNPLVRALALRTMSYIHVREYVEATVPHLKNLLRDSDPYVRKTAAFCVAKLYDHDRQLVESSDLIDKLNGMLRDENPTVVSSALAGLMDIWERSENIKLTIDYASASKIVSILADCSEWGQTYIMEAMMNYVPQDCAEAALLAERISPRIVEAPSKLDDLRRQLDEYFAGSRRSFDLPIDWALSRGFTQRILQAIWAIPFGETSNYRDVAAAAGNVKATRAAGNACGANPIPIVVPCHRIVGSTGSLVG